MSTTEEVRLTTTDTTEPTTDPPLETTTNEKVEYTSASLSARELAWAANSPELLQRHQERNGPLIRTRFPPEPNGYLHIGHAKSMNMNFRLAFDKLGVPLPNRRTIFRYDDTNPDAESAEYIDSLWRDVAWLGWEPERTTYSSDNFQQLYDFAVQLVRKDLAYVCDMTKAEMEIQRELAMRRVHAKQQKQGPHDSDIELQNPMQGDSSSLLSSNKNILPGRNRHTSVARNLRLFELMRQGCFDEGQYTLRLKMDFDSANPNMYDLVAYRIKYTSHPHAGDGWCIYPSYDFTHGICDSLESIDYSICTLEFETRREPYYWILWALDLFRPKVYEMSRLNLQYTVLSKRRLIKLVDGNLVRGWDDPRMPTLAGLRRRGYTPTIINRFCMDIGATRAPNMIDMAKLDQTARLELATTCCRVMAALAPVKLVITNFAELQAASEQTLTFVVANHATDASMGNHSVTLTEIIYIDASDFRLQDEPSYYGLVPKSDKAVGLKYHGGNIICDEVVMEDDSNGTIKELLCRLDISSNRSKPKTYISWVPSDSIECEVRVYGNLFIVPEPTDLWVDELNPDSEIVYEKALVDPSVFELVAFDEIDKWRSNTALQFERFGYFVVDYETNVDTAARQGKFVFNRIVSLKEETFKKQLTADEQAKIEARKGQARKGLEAKEIRMMIAPEDLFKFGDEFEGKYSEYDSETGIPTHDIDGQELTKTAVKKLAKEQQKHKKQLAAWETSRSRAAG